MEKDLYFKLSSINLALFDYIFFCKLLNVNRLLVIIDDNKIEDKND